MEKEGIKSDDLNSGANISCEMPGNNVEGTTTKAHIPNIHALNSDTNTLKIQYEYTQKQCVGVAIEGMDIWYMGLIACTDAKISCEHLR